MPLGVGTARGLSTVSNWDADLQRLGQNYYTVLQARQAREQKIAWMADKMKEGHANTPYTNGRLRPYYDQLNKEVSDFVINNLGFEQDLGKRREFDGLTSKYLNNDILAEDMLVMEEFNKLRDAYSNKKISNEQYELEMNKYSAYIHQKPDGSDGIQPYIFSNPLTISLDEVIDQASDSLGTVTSDWQNKTGMWYRSTSVRDEEVRKQTISILSDPLRREAVEKNYREAQETIPGFNDNIYEYVDELIKNSKDRKYMLLGDENYGKSPQDTDPAYGQYLLWQNEIMAPLAELRRDQPALNIPVRMNAPQGIDVALPVSRDKDKIFNATGNLSDGTPYTSFRMEVAPNTYKNVAIPGMVKMLGSSTEIMNWAGGNYAKSWIEFDESDQVDVLLMNPLLKNGIIEVEQPKTGNILNLSIGAEGIKTSSPETKKRYRAAVYTKMDMSAANWFSRQHQTAKSMEYEAPYNMQVYGIPYAGESREESKANTGHVNIP